MLAEIITIGDEILIGQIVDSNSAWMAQKLNTIGIKVKQITSISDDRVHILQALQEASMRAQIILITGGLGPTKDDITKKTLAEYFNSGFRTDEATLEQVKKVLQKTNPSAIFLDSNIKQAEVPQACQVILNYNGTAPGMWFEHDNHVYISMPGVPFEMMYMLDEQILPKLKTTFDLPTILHKTILTADIGESSLAKEIESIESDLPDYIKLAYLPKVGQVRLRLSTYIENIESEMERFVERIINQIPQYVIATDDITLQEAVLDVLKKHQLSLSLAESCTGGYLSHLFTQISGSSAVYKGGVVCYSNEAKINLLGVHVDTIAQHGAVSEPTVKEMAEGARANFNADVAVGITGIAGPLGGTEDKPVGTVWIAIATKNRTITYKMTGNHKRIQNIEKATTKALKMLFDELKSNIK